MTVTLIKSELYRQGGLEKYSWQIAADFCALGAPVTVLTTGQVTPPFSHPLLNLVCLPVRRSLSVLNVAYFDVLCQRYIAEHPTPIIFSLDRNRFQTHIRAGNGVHAAYLQRRCREEGVAKRVSFALNPLHRLILSLEKQAFEHPELKILFTNSEMVKREILQCYATDPQKIQVVHNGVAWHAVQPAFDQWREEPNCFQFLFIGHNFRRKGLDKLLHALALIKHEPFELSVVGKDKHQNEFEALIQRLDLSNKVRIWGPQTDIIPFYQKADCLVIPSLYDPFANVTIEALAMGLFVLSSKHNGGHEVLNEHNGTVIPDLDDSQVFAKQLKLAMTQPKTKIRAAAIRHSVGHLDFTTQLRSITQRTLQL